MDFYGIPGNFSEASVDALAVTVFKDEKPSGGFLKELDKLSGGHIAAVIKSLGTAPAPSVVTDPSVEAARFVREAQFRSQHRELEGLLALEVREEPALAHAGALRQRADGDAVEPGLAGEGEGVPEHGAPGGLSLAHLE